MTEKPYPVGTVCVIVRQHDNAKILKLGVIVTVGPATMVSRFVHHPDQWLFQQLLGFSGSNMIRNGQPHDGIYHPVAWMRPLGEDITLDDMEIAAAFRAAGKVPKLVAATREEIRSATRELRSSRRRNHE